MSVFINIHRTYRQFVAGHKRIAVEGHTVGECLDVLTNTYPDMSKALFYEDGQLRNHFEIYINMESAYPDELQKTVADGDEIHITAVLAGG